MTAHRPSPAGDDATTGQDTTAATGAPVLEVDRLVTHYPIRRNLVEWLLRRPRRAVSAVDGVTLDVRRGEILALVGETGCGKSSTVLSIVRAIEPTSGSIRIEGEEVTRLSTRAMRPVRRRTQMVYQDPYESLDPRLRVRKTVEEPLRVHRLTRSRVDRQRLVAAALERVGLAPSELYAERFPHELSGGQRQRVAIAAALILGPSLLLADEPVSMLDVSVRAGVLDLLDELRHERGMAIVLVTHDLSTAGHFADRVAVMYLGRIVEQGSASEVLSNPKHPYTKALLSVVPKSDPRRRFVPEILRGETPNPVNVPTGCRFHPRCPIAESQCRIVDPVLAEPAGAREADHLAACLVAQRKDPLEAKEAASASPS